jgi:hypothetical protein
MKHSNQQLLSPDIKKEIINKMMQVPVKNKLIGPVLVTDHLQQLVEGLDSSADQGRKRVVGLQLQVGGVQFAELPDVEGEVLNVLDQLQLDLLVQFGRVREFQQLLADVLVERGYLLEGCVGQGWGRGQFTGYEL